MAKRARGSVRPGQRRPIDRRPSASSGSGASAASRSGGSAAPRSADSASPRSAGLTEAEEARAAELEAQLLEQERQAEAARSRAKERSTREPYSGGTLAVRAEAEYAYVARDVRRIAEMAVLMLVVLISLWFLIDIAKVIPLG
jgi:hypothetical protein